MIYSKKIINIQGWKDNSTINKICEKLNTYDLNGYVVEIGNGPSGTICLYKNGEKYTTGIRNSNIYNAEIWNNEEFIDNIKNIDNLDELIDSACIKLFDILSSIDIKPSKSIPTSDILKSFVKNFNKSNDSRITGIESLSNKGYKKYKKLKDDDNYIYHSTCNKDVVIKVYDDNTYEQIPSDRIEKATKKINSSDYKNACEMLSYNFDLIEKEKSCSLIIKYDNFPSAKINILGFKGGEWKYIINLFELDNPIEIANRYIDEINGGHGGFVKLKNELFDEIDGNWIYRCIYNFVDSNKFVTEDKIVCELLGIDNPYTNKTEYNGICFDMNSVDVTEYFSYLLKKGIIIQEKSYGNIIYKTETKYRNKFIRKNLTIDDIVESEKLNDDGAKVLMEHLDLLINNPNMPTPCESNTILKKFVEALYCKGFIRKYYEKFIYIFKCYPNLLDIPEKFGFERNLVLKIKGIK